jgi:hypothetical protein
MFFLRAAVDFLEFYFSLSDSQMLALTSKGSVLTTIAFRSEEATAGRVKNLLSNNVINGGIFYYNLGAQG